MSKEEVCGPVAEAATAVRPSALASGSKARSWLVSVEGMGEPCVYRACSAGSARYKAFDDWRVETGRQRQDKYGRPYTKHDLRAAFDALKISVEPYEDRPLLLA